MDTLTPLQRKKLSKRISSKSRGFKAYIGTVLILTILFLLYLLTGFIFSTNIFKIKFITDMPTKDSKLYIDLINLFNVRTDDASDWLKLDKWSIGTWSHVAGGLVLLICLIVGLVMCLAVRSPYHVVKETIKLANSARPVVEEQPKVEEQVVTNNDQENSSVVASKSASKKNKKK